MVEDKWYSVYKSGERKRIRARQCHPILSNRESLQIGGEVQVKMLTVGFGVFFKVFGFVLSHRSKK